MEISYSASVMVALSEVLGFFFPQNDLTLLLLCVKVALLDLIYGGLMLKSG